MVKPHHILLFLLVLSAGCLTMAYFFPEDGIKVSEDLTLRFATVNEIFDQGEDSVKVDVEELLASYEVVIDSTAIKDSIKRAQIAYRQKMLRIQYPSDTIEKLPKFFQALAKTKKNGKKLRIIHYGDSQIEGDRISSYIRNKFQKFFGGNGPGYFAVKSVVNSFSVNKTISENWQRFAVFGTSDSTLNHRKFGMYGAFSRFSPIYPDSLLFADSAAVAQDTVKAWIEIRPSNIAYYTSKQYSLLNMLFGNVKKPFSLNAYVNDSLVSQNSYQAGAFGEFKLKFGKTPRLIKLEFTATYSPDIYGIRLESRGGVLLDNVGLRGSSGTFFGRINGAEMSSQLNKEPIRLVLLQFGGNTVPYIETKERAQGYSRSLKRQIKLLRRLNPKADFVVIGPSDMSTKDKTKYVTYPQLEFIRDAVKEAAFETGCGFWDIYEVMGGKNSMPSWVDADPPLAAKDYVHFTNEGAVKIAGLFYDALMKDFEAFENGKTDEQISLSQ
ncbi:MAG: GDSL-type esterase/lipase family protein [Bacteroidota bacterium]